MYTQQLKNEIVTSLDILPVESLEFLAKFVAFLKGQVTELLPSSTIFSSALVQNDNPLMLLMQLGKNPIDDDVTDASINHDRYIAGFLIEPRSHDRFPIKIK